MSTTPPPDRVAAGRARLAERARRISRIRRNVVAATLAAFALFWGVIVFDGSMGNTTVASTSTATTSTDTSTSTDNSISSTPSTGSGSSVTTGQS